MADSNQVLYVLMPVSFIGSVLNWISFYSIHKLASFNHSFGYLSANQALADALHSTVFLLYFCPMVLLDQTYMKQYSHLCGFLLLFCYELSVLTHSAISLNRYISVWSPLFYESFFSVSKTKSVIFVLWLYNGIATLVLYEKYCHFYFDDSIGFLTFNNSELCSDIGWYGDFLKNSFIVAVVLCFDIITLIGVRRVSKKLKSGMTDATIKKFSRRDRRFLKQTLIQGSVFMLELLTYFFIPQYFTNRWIVFFGTSFAWVAVHVADGLVFISIIFSLKNFCRLIVIICNPEIRNFLLADKTSLRRGTIVQVSSVVVHPQ
ncbi:hypothetical protein CRE_09196 [Caenorhabditis remanei]|uniref:G-protein coupled receptors family 1 profile domain-containing protein n=1 Tax=Caenorhabditis remanei TaxID=31234 RepID=E3LHF3_CAERE|nr:hypothetical protein CRE_09196 [Caenorhabditis remanei]